MRSVAHGIVYFEENTKVKILSMMKDYSSALRCAYQGIHKHQLKGNDLKKHVKVNYSQYLNATWVADACLQAGMINQKSSIFGGKKNWKQYQCGLLSKEQWLLSRNNQLYARGERSRQGNRQIRLLGDLKTVYVNSPDGMNLWLEGKLFIPDKFKKGLDLSCYAIRLLYKWKTDTFEIKIEYEVNAPEQLITSTLKGVVGIDTNPNLLALVETDACGNMRSHRSLKAQRISYARTEKRFNDINLLAKEVVDKAVEVGKPIVLEDLKFTDENKKKGSKKFKRMKSNFVYSKVVKAIELKALKSGVAVIKVNPAFTSKLGLLKYKEMYSLSPHIAAALCIARRGQGFKERATYNESFFTKNVKGKAILCYNLEGRKHSVVLSEKAHSWLKDCFIRESKQYIDKKSDLTGHPLSTWATQALDWIIGEIPI